MTQNPEGDLKVYSSNLFGISIDESDIPFMIDELPLVAILACVAKGKTTVSGAQELKVKESDRIEVMASNLRKMGINIKTNPEGFEVVGPQKFYGARVAPHGDHRVAMAFSIVSTYSKRRHRC